MLCLFQVLIGVYSVEVPPVPIPNTAVKLFCAYNTWLATAREDWSMPILSSFRFLKELFYYIIEVTIFFTILFTILNLVTAR